MFALFQRLLRKRYRPVALDDRFYARCLRFSQKNQALLNPVKAQLIAVALQAEPPRSGRALFCEAVGRVLDEIQDDLLRLFLNPHYRYHAIPAGAAIPLLLILLTAAPMLLQMLQESA